MDKYNDFIIERLDIKEINEARVILKNVLNDEDYNVIDLIVFQNNSIAYSGRLLGLTNGQIRHKFYNVLRKIGRIKMRNK